MWRDGDRRDAAEDLDEIVEFLEEVVMEEPAGRGPAAPPPVPADALRASRRD